MSRSAIKSFSNSGRRKAKAVLALSAVAVASVFSVPVGATPVGAYDGSWNVTFTTRAGNCSATNSAPFNVTASQISSAGGGKVSGGVSRAGAVAVNISLGQSHASGTGRLFGNSGTGRWSGVISGDQCSGTWQASRG